MWQNLVGYIQYLEFRKTFKIGFKSAKYACYFLPFVGSYSNFLHWWPKALGDCPSKSHDGRNLHDVGSPLLLHGFRQHPKCMHDGKCNVCGWHVILYSRRLTLASTYGSGWECRSRCGSGYSKRQYVQERGFQIYFVGILRARRVYWANLAYPYVFYAYWHVHDLDAPNQIHLFSEGYGTHFPDFGQSSASTDIPCCSQVRCQRIILGVHAYSFGVSFADNSFLYLWDLHKKW